MKCHLVLNLCVAACLLQGCGVSMFVPPEEDAVVDEHVFFSWNEIFGVQGTGVRALSTKAERRLVLMEQWIGSDNNAHLTVCAEPNPEATQSLKSLSDVSGELSGDVVDAVKMLAEINRELSTDVAMQFKRSQGLQFYRDGAFQLCQAYINGLLGNEDHENFLLELNSLRETAANIILHEVTHGFYRTESPKPNAPPKAQAAPSVETTTTTTSQSKETKTTEKTTKGK